MLGKKTVILITSILCLFWALSVPGIAIALPVIDNIENGDVKVESPDQNTVNITAPDRSIINFRSFDIAQNETVNFIQPSAGSSVLSRVVGSAPSIISGNLSANGMLILVNANGIHFTSTAQVQVNALIASTLDISTNNFINGNYIFERGFGREGGYILNEGMISADSIAMMAGAVNNTGIIQARVGTVHLASGDKTAVTIDRRGLIQVEITEKTSSKICDFNGVTVEDAVANSGSIEGVCEVVMSAKTSSDIFKHAVNNTGVVKVSGTRMIEDRGIIRIVGDNDIQVSGRLEGDVDAESDKDVHVDKDLTVVSGDLRLIADADLDGIGSFRQAQYATIQTVNSGDITIQSSGESTISNIISAGDLTFRQGGSLAVFTQHSNSRIITNGSVTISHGVIINASNSVYEIGRNWTSLGVFNPQNSTVKLVSEAPAIITGDITFNNFTVIVPGKTVKFTAGDTITVIGVLTLSGSYGNLLTLQSTIPDIQWKIMPLGNTDIKFTQIGDCYDARGPPLKVIHSSSLGNNTNLDLDPYWTGNGPTLNWSDPDNWDTGTVPTSFDTVTFDGVTGLNPNKNSNIDPLFAGTITHVIVNGYVGTITLARDLTLKGDFNRQTGTFDPATYTVSFIDASIPSNISGNNTFYNLRCVTPGKVLNFEPGTTATISNLLTINGENGNNVTLQSSMSGVGNEFYIYINAVSNAIGEAMVEYITVNDCIAQGPATPIQAKPGTITKRNATEWDQTYYAIASGNWSNNGTVWSLSDGGAPTAAHPVAGDTVYLTATSGAITITVDVASACAIIDCTGFTGSLVMNANLTTTGNITLSSGMTFTPNTSTWVLGCNGVALASNGKSFYKLNLQTTGTLTLTDPCSVTNTLTIVTGVITLAGNDITCGGLTQSTTSVILGARTINLTGGTWSGGTSGGYVGTNLTITGNVTISGNVYYGQRTLSATGATLTTTGSTLNFASSSCVFTDATNTWNNINLSNNSLTVTLSQPTTISGNLSVATGLTLTLAGNDIAVGGNLTCTGTGIIQGQTITMTGASGTATWSSGGGKINSNLIFLGGANTITVTGNVYFGGSNTPTLTYTSGTMALAGSTLNIAGSCTFTDATNTWVNINGSATATLTLSQNTTISGNLTCTSGNLILAYRNITIDGNLTVSGTSIVAQTITMTGASGTATWSGSGYVGSNLTFLGGVNTITVSGNVYYGSAASPVITYTSGVMALAGSTLNIRGDTTLTDNTNTWVNINCSSTSTTTLTLSQDTTISGNLSTSSLGQFALASHNIFVGGNLSLSSAAITGQTITMTGASGTATWTSSGGSVASNLTFLGGANTITVSGTVRKSTGTLTYTSGNMVLTGSTLNMSSTFSFSDATNAWANVDCTGNTNLTLLTNLSLSGNLTIESGVKLKIIGAKGITIGGNWINNGTYTHGTETVVFNGNNIISGSTTFYNLKCTAAGSALTFTRGTEQIVTNSLILAGTTASPLAINDTGAGAVPKLTLNSGATQSIANVNVTNNDASGGTQLIAHGTSSLSGTTTNWTIGSAGATFRWTGAVSTDWNTAGNWDMNAVPSSIDDVIIPSTATNNPSLANNVTVNALTVYSGGALSTGGYALTVSGDAILDGVLNAGSSVVNIGGNLTGSSGKAITGDSPFIFVAGHTGTSSAPLGFSVTGTVTFGASGMSNMTSISVNGSGRITFRGDIPGFVIVNGSIRPHEGQKEIRGMLNQGESVLYREVPLYDGLPQLSPGFKAIMAG